MTVTAVVNFYEDGEDMLGYVEIENAPLPREGEIVYTEWGVYEVQQVRHDTYQKSRVKAPEIILDVEDVSDDYE
ncbi:MULTISPECIES: hypothetical protein [Halorussus]|uniref:Uncharacterized protein n=2 Tax=Halorussus TaxID=1070314 RepID=A0A8U0HUQ9_9EURY|nr:MULTISPECIES: hypothetical protein [Halorussus]UPV74579.1 hypothetical protein M0R89_00575 [Halorussus limi]